MGEVIDRDVTSGRRSRQTRLLTTDVVIPKVRKHVTLRVEKEDMAVLKVRKNTRY